MGLFLSAVAGFALWIILWSIEVKAIDAFLITALILLLAVTARMLAPYIPGNRQ